MSLPLNQIINADCLDFMRTLPDKCIDLVLTDPPYGIDAANGVGGGIYKGRKYEGDWDVPPKQEYFDEILRVSKQAIIFGGNFFTDMLPLGRHWIVWDKVGEIAFDNPYSGAELAWTNMLKNTVKKYVIIQAGFISEEKDRFHATQKPVKLFKHIIEDYTKEYKECDCVNDPDELSGEPPIILDPFAGSCTTAIAASQLKRNWICVEKEKKYCDIGQKRLDAMTKQLF